MAAPPKMTRTRTPGVFKRGGRYVVTWRDADNKPRKQSTRTYDDARALKRKRDEEARNGVALAPRPPTFAAYQADWIERYTGTGRRGFRENTRDDYRRDLAAYAVPFLGERLLLTQLDHRRIGKFVMWLCDEEQQERRLSDASVRRILAPVSSCLATAMREGLISGNPARGVALPTRPGIPKEDEEVRVLTRDELARFLACVEPGWELFFETLAHSGARWSEAAAWMWRDAVLDADQPHLRVRRTIVRNRWGEPKSKYARREIPIPTALATKLRLRRDAICADDGDLIFPAENGAPLRSENVRRRALRRAAKQAGVDWIGFHTFRHTAASLLFERNGGNVVKVQRFLGHHSPAFTLATYLHMIDTEIGDPLDLSIELAA
jgi:integrase